VSLRFFGIQSFTQALVGKILCRASMLLVNSATQIAKCLFQQVSYIFQQKP